MFTVAVVDVEEVMLTPVKPPVCPERAKVNEPVPVEVKT